MSGRTEPVFNAGCIPSFFSANKQKQRKTDETTLKRPKKRSLLREVRLFVTRKKHDNRYINVL